MITVLLPTYNSEEYIFEAIQSILSQTFRDYELLIVDDGSIDNTQNIVRSYTDARIKYIWKEHSGLVDSLNYGLRIAKYEWIARMDADDISHPKRLEKQIEVLNKKPYIDWISNWHSTFSERPSNTIKLPENSSEIRNGLILSNSVCFPSSVFRKQVVINAGGFKGSIFEDYKLLLKIKDNCNFYNIQEVLYFQRKREKSLSRNNFEKTKKIIYDFQQPYYEDLQNQFNLKSILEVQYYKGWREYAYGNKNKARKYWSKLGFSIVFYPKALIGWVFSFMPDKYFFYFRKMGINLVLFYSPFVSSDVKSTFQNIKKGNGKSI